MTIGEDFAQLCLLPGTGSSIVSIVGLFLDIFGFWVLIEDLLRTQDLLVRKSDTAAAAIKMLNDGENAIRGAGLAGALPSRDPMRAAGQIEKMLNAESFRAAMTAESQKLAFQYLAKEQEVVSASAQTTMKRTRIAAVLVVIGFLLQIYGAMPC